MIVSRAALLVTLWLLGCGSPSGMPAESPAPGEALAAEAPEFEAPEAALGDGFAVWESLRTGDWRIWRRRLDGTGLEQLTPDEDGRQHCCPHISPDGRWVAFLPATSRATCARPTRCPVSCA